MTLSPIWISPFILPIEIFNDQTKAGTLECNTTSRFRMLRKFDKGKGWGSTGGKS